LVSEVAGKRLQKRHNLTGPQGVRGRNSDNALVRRVLGWEPSILLLEGLRRTYPWIEEELRKAGRLSSGSLVSRTP
jgi:nucleoside-diphosphate-sugar epimerase